jgi:hypothetical protein
MVGQGEQPTKKTIKAIARETEEVLARVARLEEAAADKKHNERSARQFGIVRGWCWGWHPFRGTTLKVQPAMPIRP